MFFWIVLFVLFFILFLINLKLSENTRKILFYFVAFNYLLRNI